MTKAKLVLDSTYVSKLVFGKEKYSRLTHNACVGYFIEGTAKKRRAAHSFTCECGTSIIVRGKDVKSGAIQSCGCLAKVSKSKNGRANTKPDCSGYYKLIYYRYQYSATRRNLPFNLEFNYFKSLIQAPCHYCGFKGSNMMHSAKTACILPYNGIDRINSKLGYTIDNTVSCCKFCNFAKYKHSQAEFLNWLNTIRMSV